MDPKDKLAEVTAEGLKGLMEFVKAGADLAAEQAPLLLNVIVTGKHRTFFL